MGLEYIHLDQENEKYILTDEAARLIRQAYYMRICFESKNNERVTHNCWLEIGIKTIIKKIGVEAEAIFRMPINVRGISTYSTDWKFFYKVDLIEPGGAVHPIIGLVQKGSILEFQPGEGDYTNNMLKEQGMVGDVIYWHLTTKGTRYKNVFAVMNTYANSSCRLIQKSERTNLNLHTTATNS